MITLRFMPTRHRSRESELHGASSVATLRTNLSFVLHEPSTSASVVSAAGWPKPSLKPGQIQILGASTLSELQPDTILTAHIGLPSLLSDIASRLPDPPSIVAIDAPVEAGSATEFFRAPANLSLPEWPASRIVVAAVVIRPGGRSVELVTSSPRRWPDDAVQVLRDLERLIQTHADQWFPPRALWSAPAEVLLPEVSTQLSSSTPDAG